MDEKTRVKVIERTRQIAGLLNQALAHAKDMNLRLCLELTENGYVVVKGEGDAA